MKRVTSVAAVSVLTVLLFAGTSHAGPPFNNLEGVGGVAFNPLAYPAYSAPAEGAGDLKIGAIDIGKPRFGAWYVNLNDVDIDWTAIGVADTFFKRLELSYGYESVAIAAVSKNTHKNNLGAKLLLINENAFGSKAVPAVSVGGIWKSTSFEVAPGVDDKGVDLYLVATKLITELPRPVLVSAGVLSTKGRVNGILGFDDKREEVFFGNIDLLVTNSLALGFEYKQGPHFQTFKNADYWEAHIGWLANKNLTLIAAYAYAGDRFSATKFGLGGGTVVSAQYSF